MNVRFILGVIMMIALLTTTIATSTLPSHAFRFVGSEGKQEAPIAISGDNIYIAWWTDKETPNSNGEVMLRVSTDGGATFGNKINLSNTTNADSWRVEIAGEGDNVSVSWWETNQTSDTPVTRVSTDAGQTFGPVLMLATNGTIGEAADEGTEEGE